MALTAQFNCVPFKDEAWHAANRRVDEKALENIKSTTVLLNADAAGDEGKAQEMLGPGSQHSEIAPSSIRAEVLAAEAFFENLLGQHEDVTHASTRLTQRGWASIPALAECYSKMVGSGESPCRILMNSDQWQKKSF